jgi:hypothetical protein
MSNLPPTIDDAWDDNPLRTLPLTDDDQQAASRLNAWIGRHEFAYDERSVRRTPLIVRAAAAAGILLLLGAFAAFNLFRMGNHQTIGPAATPSATSSPTPSASTTPTPVPSPSPQVATPGPANPPPAGSWAPLPAPMAVARADFTATLMPDGKVLVVGGVADVTVAGTATSDVEIYDPATKRFTAAAPLSIGRAGHTATLLPNGKVLVAGGYTQLGNAALATVEVYDPATNSWSIAAPMAHRRADQAAVLIGGGRVMVVGGSDYPPVGIGPHGSAPAVIPPEIYDPATDTWSTVALQKLDRPVDPTATLLKDGRVLVVGGQYMWNSPDEATERSEVYNVTSNTWSDVTPDARFAARQYQSATLLGNGFVLVAGGSVDLQPVGTAALYNPSSNSWIELPNMSANRCGQGAQLLSSGRVLLVASGCWNKESSGVDEFDPASNRWYPVASLASPRGSVVTVGLPDGTVLALGGTQGSVASADAELFNPS